MTKKFTPPTTFPHECIYDGTGEKVTLIGQKVSNDFVFAYEDENGLVSAAHCNCFRDIPTVTSTWQNVYADRSSMICSSRMNANAASEEGRIAVLRRDTINGVTTCVLEDV